MLEACLGSSELSMEDGDVMFTTLELVPARLFSLR